MLAHISLQEMCRIVPGHSETHPEIGVFPQLIKHWMPSAVLMMNYIFTTLGKLQKGWSYYPSTELG